MWDLTFFETLRPILTLLNSLDIILSMTTLQMGPRAQLKEKQIHVIVEEKMLLQREEVARQQDSPDNVPLESTAQHSQRQSKDWLSKETPEDIVVMKKMNCPKRL